MHVNCGIERRNELVKLNWLQKLKNFLLISSEHLASTQFFRSDKAIRQEQQRQLKLGYYIIHPFSKFRAWYELWLIILFSSLMVTKPIDGSFIREQFYTLLPLYKCWTLFTDLMSLADIFATFSTGFVTESNTIELNRTKIFKKYLFSVYFITDLLSSLPKSIFHWPIKTFNLRICNGLINIFCLLKIIRLPTLVKYFYKVAHYFGNTSNGTIFLFCSFFVSTIIIHYMACLQFAIPRLTQRYFVTGKRRYDSWIYDNQLFKSQSLMKQYTISFFKSSAYILGIRIVIFKTTLPEEYALAIFTYIIGKFLIAFVWIILAVAILNSRSMETKYLDVVNQLNEYMTQKHFPPKLKNRINQYYKFKYQNKYFKEDLVTRLLSTNLKIDVEKHLCKSLIKNVSFFDELSPVEVDMIVNCLIPELFLPNDVIVKSGTYAKAMYFLSSGTVAAYTHSGKELCHMQDGAYFGDICLVLKSTMRIATVVAIETSQVYRLNKNDFFKTLYKNKAILKILKDEAESKLEMILNEEEAYKRSLFEQEHQT